MQDEQLYITLKAVQYWDIDTLDFFLGLFPGIDIKFYQSEFTPLIKDLIKLEKSIFAFVVKTIFDSRKALPTIATHSFIN